MLQLSPAVSLRRPFLRVWRTHHSRTHALCRPQAAAASSLAGPEAPASQAQQEPTSAYVHLPFCKKKCRYCDFPVIAVGMSPPVDHMADNMRAYVDLLCQEIAATQKLNQNGPLKTVFFGGGTPSLISLPMLERLLRELDAAFGIQVGAEISIEADPGTFDAAWLRSAMSLGISRVSVGVQSFDDNLLQVCGRAHDVRDAYRAIEAIYAAGVPNWSLDLMSGLPYLTPEGWHRSLEAAVDAAPQHLSIYDLQVEEHTPFAKLYRPGVSPLPPDDEAAAMYCTASRLLRGAGYEHYEVSNYAKPGYRCEHNMVYWEGKPFYGFGMGSASYLQGRRFSRPKRLNAYRQWVEDFAAASQAGALLAAGAASSGSRDGGREEEESAGGRRGLPGADLPPETAHEKLLDTVMLRLRLSEGLDLRTVIGKNLDGEPLAKVVLRALQPHIEKGLVECLPPGDELAPAGSGANGSSSVSMGSERTLGPQPQRGVELRAAPAGQGTGSSGSSSSSGGCDESCRVRLTDPEGFLVSNDIIADVFAALDDGTSAEDSD